MMRRVLSHSRNRMVTELARRDLTAGADHADAREMLALTRESAINPDRKFLRFRRAFLNCDA